MMSKGFVLRLKQKDAKDGFRAAYDALKDKCFSDSVWWFGWHETDIRLPCPLSTDEVFDPGWDVARVFSPIAELRAQRRHSERLVLLLTELAELVNAAQELREFEVSLLATFAAEPSCRVLVGQKPDKPINNPNALVEVAFPRELNYGIPAGRGEMLIADVLCYFDDEHRLRFVRYCTVQAEQIGQREVKPLCGEENHPKSLTN